jgi:hypothetical protein
MTIVVTFLEGIQDEQRQSKVELLVSAQIRGGWISEEAFHNPFHG